MSNCCGFIIGYAEVTTINNWLSEITLHKRENKNLGSYCEKNS